MEITNYLIGYGKAMYLVSQTTREGSNSQGGQIFRIMALAPSSDNTITLQFDRVIGDENTRS